MPYETGHSWQNVSGTVVRTSRRASAPLDRRADWLGSSEMAHLVRRFDRATASATTPAARLDNRLSESCDALTHDRES
jgi:hypothetical protein